MKKISIFISLASVLVISLGAYFIYNYIYLGSKIETPKDENYLSEELRSEYFDIHLSALRKVEDPEFYNYVVSELEPACPFYDPDGKTYRNCLVSLIKQHLSAPKKSAEEVDAIKEYCNFISKPYMGELEATDLYNSCMVYKFR